jgi:hypothetical protein
MTAKFRPSIMLSLFYFNKLDTLFIQYARVLKVIT